MQNKKIIVKNPKNILISNGTYLDYGSEIVVELKEHLIVNEKASNDEVIIAIAMATEIISRMYEKIFESNAGNDIEIE